MKSVNKRTKFFAFGIRFSSLLLLLIVPVILWFGLVNLSSHLLEKTSLYNQPLEITHTWAARSVRRIKGADLEKENIIKFPLTVSGITLNIIAEVNRAPKNEEEEKQIMGAIFWEASKGIHEKEMMKEMLKPTGHKRAININKGGLTSTGSTTKAILISVISLLSIVLYYPIITALLKLAQNR